MFVFIFVATVVLTRITEGLSEKGCNGSDCDNDCGIVGKWKNELGSTVIFTSCKNGQIEGKYNTAVGNAAYYYVLTGRYTKSGPEDNVLELGWVVSWNNEKYGNSNSATSWNGIYYAEEGVIYTQWILTRYAERKNLWNASWVNHDEFRPDQ